MGGAVSPGAANPVVKTGAAVVELVLDVEKPDVSVRELPEVVSDEEDPMEVSSPLSVVVTSPPGVVVVSPLSVVFGNGTELLDRVDCAVVVVFSGTGTMADEVELLVVVLTKAGELEPDEELPVMMESDEKLVLDVELVLTSGADEKKEDVELLDSVVRPSRVDEDGSVEVSESEEVTNELVLQIESQPGNHVGSCRRFAINLRGCHGRVVAGSAAGQGDRVALDDDGVAARVGGRQVGPLTSWRAVGAGGGQQSQEGRRHDADACHPSGRGERCSNARQWAQCDGRRTGEEVNG